MTLLELDLLKAIEDLLLSRTRYLIEVGQLLPQVDHRVVRVTTKTLIDILTHTVGREHQAALVWAGLFKFNPDREVGVTHAVILLGAREVRAVVLESYAWQVVLTNVTLVRQWNQDLHGGDSGFYVKFGANLLNTHD